MKKKILALLGMSVLTVGALTACGTDEDPAPGDDAPLEEQPPIEEEPTTGDDPAVEDETPMDEDVPADEENTDENQ
ncbi:hypothetical protein SH601_00700 [Gracilibacillus sp. S3-1-1]|uniref:Uncharacterized protein n=1 Tax=Gracilibacillus pellucidus TaxID=3095368 RepID=A0ACC6M0S2_9BACI|nr:hypothetical protein [Gracilibacillus sp. S3-1-1]MDX8044491.1 hypothetical protein [Gracilibacillus sp. S3-1-1]